MLGGALHTFPNFLLLLVSLIYQPSIGSTGPVGTTRPPPLAVQSFNTGSGGALSHFVYSAATDTFFVGGTNVLLELNSSTLEVVQSVDTGPRLDSPVCHASGCSATVNVTRSLTDNVNKVLVLDAEGEKLISCGSLFQGSCSKHSLGRLEDSEFLPEPVAANDNASSTFAFIGPQRYNRWGHGNVLYVGTTFTHEGDYRHDVPAISSRNLHDLRFAEYSFSKQSLLRIDVKYRDRFLVQYVYGFATETHVYFATVQKRSHIPGNEDRGFITRLARACISDPNFDTYSEVTLECHSKDGNVHNILKAATFSSQSAEEGRAGEGSMMSEALNLRGNDSYLMATFVGEEEPLESSVCVFPLSTIEMLFEENIHNCFNGSMQYRNLEYVSGPIQEGKCPTIGKGGNIFNFCQVGLKISGRFSIRSQSMIRIRGTATSIALDAGGSGLPVLFLGTDAGKVLGVKVLAPDNATIFHEFPLGSAAVKELYVLNDFVYFLTAHQLGKIPVADCGSLGTCEKCSSSLVPYCGWCPSTSECTNRRRCPSVAGGWLMSTSARHQQTQECIQVVKVVPDVLSPSSPFEDIYLYMTGVANGNESYVCKYDGDKTVQARRFEGGLVCDNPLASVDSKDLENVSLSLAYAQSSSPILVTSLKILDCPALKSCSDCLGKSSSCRWCFSAQTCLHKNDVASCNGGGTSGAACPRIVNRNSILIPNNVPSAIKMNFDFVPQAFVNSNIFCMVSLEGAKMKIPAKLRGSSVTCERTSYRYLTEQSELNATIRVIAGGDDNAAVIDEATIVLFKCELLGKYRNTQDCALCLSREDKYGCSWCGPRCTFSGQCSEDSSATACPKPEIFSVTPSRGPLEGGTLVTLDGINLKVQSESSQTKVRVGDRICQQLGDEQATGSSRGEKARPQVSCLTASAPRAQNSSVEIESERGASRAYVMFEYTDYIVLSVSPGSSPVSGGVTLVLSGRNLDIGYKRQVFLNEVPCLLDDRRDGSSGASPDHISCVLGGTSQPSTKSNLSVKIDNAVRSFPVRFQFFPDPIVSSVKPLSSYVSGGRLISIHGQHFSSLPSCELVVYTGGDSNQTLTSNCTVVTDKLLECISPSLKGVLLPPPKTPLPLEIGLRTANVTSLLYLKSAFPLIESDLSYVADPSYFNLSHGYTVSDKDSLVIEGAGISLASDLSDVRVRIGQSYCNVTSITNNQLLCFPPKDRPTGTDGKQPELVVLVGERLQYNLGLVQFALDKREEFSSEIIGAISAAAAILVFLAVVILIILKHKSSEVEREYKRIQIQMDILEHNVRSECKQAFAELQTDMTDLTVELETSGIPIFPRKVFLMKVFFPGVENHPVVLTQFDQDQQVASSTRQFENFLLDKNFLLMLVDTLENQPTFGVRDKINFASLLSIFLCTRMDYFSDVLRTLLGDFLRRAPSLKHPEALLRRSESILEKMLTNWLSICLYDYIKDDIGPPLFLLCKAIKYQIEKGPVDAVTQEAKYSLSEEGLLHASGLEYAVINCLVLQRELEEAYETKVLDCDSISQVKGKILDSVYKNTPFSLRPGVHEVDLEWQCGQDAHVVLQDIDLTTEVLPGECKRINTLKHYGIKNKALMSLVPKQFRKTDSLSKSGTKLYHLQAAPDSTSSSSSSSSTSNSSSTATASHSGSGGSHTTYRPSKTVPEVYLTRLLATKGTLKKYIDDFAYGLTSIRGRFPCSVKWLFDLIDEAGGVDAAGGGAVDGGGVAEDVLHSWKANCVPLRLWITLLKNPDLIYDVERSFAGDNNLSVIAQIILGSCNFGSTDLTKEAPPHKLLFAKELVDFQTRIGDFFSGIQRLPVIPDYEFSSYMSQLSLKQAGLFNECAALQELLLYVKSHMNELNQALAARQACQSI